MRDLSSDELAHVYGAGSRGKSPAPPSKKNKCKPRGGSSSHGYKGGHKRCGKGSSS